MKPSTEETDRALLAVLIDEYGVKLLAAWMIEIVGAAGISEIEGAVQEYQDAEDQATGEGETIPPSEA